MSSPVLVNGKPSRFGRGDTVVVRGNLNPVLQGRQATVESVTPYGYVLTGTGVGTGQYRALASEVEPAAGSVVHVREQGFTGDVCFKCGGAKMVRNGSCLLCVDCGETTGCS